MQLSELILQKNNQHIVESLFLNNKSIKYIQDCETEIINDIKKLIKFSAVITHQLWANGNDLHDIYQNIDGEIFFTKPTVGLNNYIQIPKARLWIEDTPHNKKSAILADQLIDQQLNLMANKTNCRLSLHQARVNVSEIQLTLIHRGISLQKVPPIPSSLTFESVDSNQVLKNTSTEQLLELETQIIKDIKRSAKFNAVLKHQIWVNGNDLDDIYQNVEGEILSKKSNKLKDNRNNYIYIAKAVLWFLDTPANKKAAIQADQLIDQQINLVDKRHACQLNIDDLRIELSKIQTELTRRKISIQDLPPNPPSSSHLRENEQSNIKLKNELVTMITKITKQREVIKHQLWSNSNDIQGIYDKMDGPVIEGRPPQSWKRSRNGLDLEMKFIFIPASQSSVQDTEHNKKLINQLTPLSDKESHLLHTNVELGNELQLLNVQLFRVQQKIVDEFNDELPPIYPEQKPHNEMVNTINQLTTVSETMLLKNLFETDDEIRKRQPAKTNQERLVRMQRILDAVNHQLVAIEDDIYEHTEHGLRCVTDVNKIDHTQFILVDYDDKLPGACHVLPNTPENQQFLPKLKQALDRRIELLELKQTLEDQKWNVEEQIKKDKKHGTTL